MEKNNYFSHEAQNIDLVKSCRLVRHVLDQEVKGSNLTIIYLFCWMIHSTSKLGTKRLLNIYLIFSFFKFFKYN